MRRHWPKIVLLSGFGLVVLIIAFLTVVISRDLPAVPGQVTYQQAQGSWQLSWPGQGQAAIGTLSDGVKATSGGNSPRPIASLAKVITTLVALETESFCGDSETVVRDQIDVDFWRATVAQNGSNLYVVVGEQLTERQMLEALLIVSANNMADSLVRRVFGDQAHYQAAAERWLAENDLLDTRIGADASGLDPGTVSTPSDMVKIGQLALKNPLIADIVRQTSATFPTVGEVKNSNKLLSAGYRGIKTGNSNEALACLLFAEDFAGQTLIGVVMGQQFGTATDAAQALVDSYKQGLTEITIPAGSVVGHYQTPWGQTAVAITVTDLTTQTWPNQQPQITLDAITPPEYGNKNIGTIELGTASAPIRLDDTITQPDIVWRLQNLDHLKWQIKK
jgi:D-alanyl-D-alanine carboxypeptidase (penicillin-binding protein 5/6)